LIRAHEFNSTWWGGPAGIIEGPAFFALPADEQKAALTRFEWVEFRSSATAAPPAQTVNEAGFLKADTQIPFRIGLREFPRGCTADLTLRSAADPDFSLDASDWEIFEHERFRLLPGVTPERLNARYAMWAEALRESDPEHCFQILQGGAPQGWFLGHAESSDTVNLTLGVLRHGASISGFTIYQAALKRFAGMGYRIGTAAFSASNTAVLNIYSKLGARFTCPSEIWMWMRRPA